MIFGEVSKNGHGLVLLAEYHDLQFLYQALNKIIESDNLSEYEREWACNITYELRKGYEGTRITRELDCIEYSNRYIELSFIWPQFLLYMSIIRKGLDFASLTHKEKLYFLVLESTAKEAISDISSDTASKIFNIYPINVSEKYLFNFIQEVTIDFVKMKTSREAKVKMIFDSVLKLDSLFSKDYKAYEKKMVSLAKENNSDPRFFEYSGKLPDFDL